VPASAGALAAAVAVIAVLHAAGGWLTGPPPGA